MEHLDTGLLEAMDELIVALFKANAIEEVKQTPSAKLQTQNAKP